MLYAYIAHLHARKICKLVIVLLRLTIIVAIVIIVIILIIIIIIIIVVVVVVNAILDAEGRLLPWLFGQGHAPPAMRLANQWDFLVVVLLICYFSGEIQTHTRAR